MPGKVESSNSCMLPLPGASQLLFSQLVARMPVPIAVVDRDLAVRFANPCMCEHVGRPLTELLGTRVDEFVVGISYDEELRRMYGRCFAGESVTDEAWIAYRERGLRFVRIALEPIGDPQGVVAYALVTLQDLTEQRQAEHANVRLERAFRALCVCYRVVLGAHDEGRLVQDVCRVAVDLGGYRMAWVGAVDNGPNRLVTPIASAGDDEHYLDGIRVSWAEEPEGSGPTGRAVRRKEPVVATSLLTEPGYGPWRNRALRHGYRSAAAFPLLAGTEVVGTLSLYACDAEAFDGREVDLLRKLAENVGFGIASLRAHAEREQLRQRLLFADRMSAMGTLAAGVAHEINSPLAYIIANLDLMARDFGDVAAHVPPEVGVRFVERLEQAREGSEHVRQITKDLRVFSRPDDHGPELTDACQVLEASIRMAWSEIKHRAELVREIEQHAMLVRAEPSRLGQAFLNLLINAAHAIPEGNANQNRITVGIRREGPNMVLTVADTGTGIRPEHVPHVFEPFFTTKPIGIGTGLGLPIVRDIITGFGGTITLETALGRGTTFTMCLPADVQPPPTEQPQQVSAEADSSLPGRLLVVDDDDGIRDVIRDALSEHEVVTSEDGRAALVRIRAGERFDVILCDMMMPQMTGVQFHGAVSALDPAQAERVVFMTGGAFTAKTREFLASVRNGRFEKPFDLELLRRVVGQAFSRHGRLERL